MESTEEQERLSWNEVSRLFWRRDTIPATFIDQSLLVEQIDLGVFGKPDSMDITEHRALALFKLITDEGDRYALTVAYIPYYQKQMDMKTALQAVHSTMGNAVALVGMPQDYTKCAYMPEPVSGKHYTLLPVCGDAGLTFGPVGDFCGCRVDQGVHPLLSQQASGGEVTWQLHS